MEQVIGLCVVYVLIQWFRDLFCEPDKEEYY